ncbi:glycoside hydrolase family 2 protein [Chitinophaga sp. GCM10012297]|uniref:Glycoside hydrolase family 2 n=1 Tax=Chitinophaga chungangae TaxID=2821488 RepID=A0ABS3YAH4_9BACT|nr:sugar-binding domain-containing protein [Chitinophaga chungangae]MBO9151677.1 glycoside hydrolase family 2 [Chitinophaga chungangae]
MIRRLIIIFLFASLGASAQTMPLAGKWQYRLDPEDKGVKEEWFNQRFERSLQLPGTLDDAGVGNATRLTPDSLNKEILLMLTRKHSYTGPAWYAKEVTIPASWQHKSIRLTLERVLWNTRVWVDGKECGADESLIAPHRFSATTVLTPGKHRLVIRVDNRKRYDMSTRDMAHAYTNGTQIVWNGVIGKLQLEARDKVHILQMQAYPDVTNRSVRVAVQVNNESAAAANGRVSIQAGGKTRSLEAAFPPGVSTHELQLQFGENMKTWDEFHPNLYTLKTSITAGNLKDAASTTFGMREVTNKNALLQVNGKRIFLRGTLECNIFPLTGHPPMDRKGWQKVFSSAKAYGLNHLRFHSWCPPSAAFEVADSMGFYLQVELPFWNKNAGKDPAMNAWLENEAARISAEYGNHPSFCFWSMGNELEGDFQWLENIVASLKKSDPRHLYTTTTFSFQRDHGKWPEPGDDFYITQYTRKGWVRGQGIFNSIPPSFATDYTKETDSLPVPIITHEIGQYSVFPNLNEIKKYTGVLDPLNFKAIKKDMERKGLVQLAPQYLLASGKFAANLYKEEIERALKTRNFSGFQLLDLHDFPGQGTALIGILDAFWDSKGLVTPAQHRMYCSAVVPLLRFEKATYTNNETFTATAEAANFSENAITGVTPEWTVKNKQGALIASGKLEAGQIPLGNGHTLGNISVDLGKIKTASELTITLRIGEHRNEWRIWVYPSETPTAPASVHYTRSLPEAMQWLNEGKTVLLNPDTASLNGVEGRFAPVFWSPVHFPSQPGTMGILCNPQHPALAAFPTAAYSDWQWWDLITSSKTLVIDSLPNLTPVVRVMDNFFKNRKMANVLEARVGKGKLVFTSLDLHRNLASRPAARQLRYSIEKYMAGAAFRPTVVLTEQQLKGLMK